MRPILALPLVGLSLALLPSCDSEPPLPELGPEVTPIIEGNNAFALDLYTKLQGDSDTNLFFSPYSISSALAMTYAGARGETETEMAEVLHLTLPQEETHPLMGSVSRYLNGGGADRGYQLRVANRLWARPGLGLLDPYQDLVRTNYGAEITQLDFAGDTEGARRTINGWVEEKTEEKIKDLLKAGVLKPNTSLVLTNAIYFKGDWASQFKKSDTRPAPFHRPDGTKGEEVPLMFQSTEFRFAELDDLKMLELPYRNDELSMWVLLPKKKDGLGELEASLSTENLAKWSSQLRKEETNVFLPRFKMTAEFELGETLQGMGMSSAFNDADFSGMTGSRDLLISNVVHKAFVAVDEEGTEAAAATAVIMVESASMVAEFRADHPFLFLIREQKTGAILFLGRVVKP